MKLPGFLTGLYRRVSGAEQRANTALQKTLADFNQDPSYVTFNLLRQTDIETLPETQRLKLITEAIALWAKKCATGEIEIPANFSNPHTHLFALIHMLPDTKRLAPVTQTLAFLQTETNADRTTDSSTARLTLWLIEALPAEQRLDAVRNFIAFSKARQQSGREEMGYNNYHDTRDAIKMLPKDQQPAIYRFLNEKLTPATAPELGKA